MNFNGLLSCASSLAQNKPLELAIDHMLCIEFGAFGECRINSYRAFRLENMTFQD